MPSLLVPSVPYYRNPQLRPGLAALVEFLMERDYSSHAIGRIFDFAACNGTLEGSLIEPDDMADAEAAFVDNLPALDYHNPAWGSDEDLEDLDVPPISDGPDAPDADPRIRFPGIASLAERMAPPPIAGGSPEPYVPTEADWEDYRRWSEAMDARDELRAMEDARNPMWGYE
jgi:hypothetical protein